jgi:SAM-dependent methyltransferase
MFNGKYLDWNQKRIKGIIDFYGHKFIFYKKILDLGCGHADIGGVFYRLGADVTAVDARQEHLKIANKKYPGIKTVKADLDLNWPFIGKTFDIILDLGLLCHLKNYEAHLRAVCNSTNYLVLETAVCDSDDPNKCVVLNENKGVYDASANGVSSRLSPAFIERILTDCGMRFQRMDLPKFNSGSYVYNWTSQNNGDCDINKRRIWFALKNTDLDPSKTPSLITTPSIISVPSKPTPLSNSYVPVTTKKAQPLLPAAQEHIPVYEPVNIINKSLSDLKVAVCLSGHMRTFEKTGPSIVNNLIKPTKADVFIHTWDTLGFDPGRGDANSLNMQTSDYLDKINSMFSPKDIVVEKFFNQNKDKYVNRVVETRDPANVLGMFYKIKKCNEIKQAYEEKNGFLYDVVIRCRPDLNLDSPINTADFKNINSVFIPAFDFYLGYNDKFAFGTSKAMDIYSLCYDYISTYYDKGCIFNAESIMKFHFNYFAIPLKRCNIKYTIFRVDGFKFSNT